MVRLQWGREELAVVSFGAPVFVVPEGLTSSEAEVAAAALEGLSNAEIARRRRVSVRTIANQLASAYRKLGLSGRAALARRCAPAAPGGRP